MQGNLADRTDGRRGCGNYDRRGEYPDFIDGGDGMAQLYDAGALVALDDYIDDYPNIKEYLTDQEWDKLRQRTGIFIDQSVPEHLRRGKGDDS